MALLKFLVLWLSSGQWSFVSGRNWDVNGHATRRTALLVLRSSAAAVHSQLRLELIIQAKSSNIIALKSASLEWKLQTTISSFGKDHQLEFINILWSTSECAFCPPTTSLLLLLLDGLQEWSTGEFEQRLNAEIIMPSSREHLDRYLYLPPTILSIL